MNSSNNLNAGQKKLSMQMLTLAAVVILIAVIGFFIQKNDSSTRGFRDYQRSTKLLKDVYSVHTNLYRIQSMVATSQDKQEIARISDQQAAVINEDVNLVKKALDSDLSVEQKKYYQGIMANLVEYQKSVLRVIKLAPVNAATPYMSASNERMEAITQLLAQLLDYESRAGEGGYGSSNLVSYGFIVLLLILLALSVWLVPAFVKKTIDSSVVEPLQETSGVLHEFAGGKYGKPLTWDADDAIGELVQSVNALRSKLSSTPKVPVPEAVPAPAPTPADDKNKSLSNMIKKAPEQAKDEEQLVMSSKKAIDKLQDI